MKEKLLIINADDFGMNSPTNTGILNLFKEKRITSTTLLAPGKKAEEAALLASEHDLAVGVHWTLTSEYKDDLWKGISNDALSLTNNGFLYYDHKKIKDLAKSKDVTKELEAQYRWLINKNIKPTHGDSHQGTLYGINGRLFFFNAFKICKKHNLPFRFPKSNNLLKLQLGENYPKILSFAMKLIVFISKFYGVKLLDDLIFSAQSVEELKDYKGLEDVYVNLIKNVKPGITELFLHPSPYDEEILSKDPSWIKRVWEYNFLLSDTFIKTVKENNIKLVSWKKAFLI